MITKAKALEILERSAFDELKGEVESDEVDFKLSKYRVKGYPDSEKQKYELTKDIVSFANASGGLILIGVRTTRSSTHFGDEASSIEPVDVVGSEHDQYSSIVGTLSYPAFAGIQVRAFPSNEDPGKGLVAIIVEKATDDEFPVLVSQALVDGKIQGSAVAVFERKQARTDFSDPSKLHGLLKKGLRFEATIEDSLLRMGETLDLIRASRAPVSAPAEPLVRVDDRVAEAVVQAGKGLPAYVLLAVPDTKLEIHELLLGRETAIIKKLENPPEIRSNGFEFVGGVSRIVPASSARRIHHGQGNLLEAHTDGLVIFVAPADRSYLTWASKDVLDSINPVLLVETITLFCRLVHQFYAGKIAANGTYRIELQLKTAADHKMTLEAGIRRFPRNLKLVPVVDAAVGASVPFSMPADAVAYRVVSAFYAFVGHEPDAIPLAKEVNGVWIIDEEAIRNVRG